MIKLNEIRKQVIEAAGDSSEDFIKSKLPALFKRVNRSSYNNELSNGMKAYEMLDAIIDNIEKVEQRANGWMRAYFDKELFSLDLLDEFSGSFGGRGMSKGGLRYKFQLNPFVGDGANSYFIQYYYDN